MTKEQQLLALRISVAHTRIKRQQNFEAKERSFRNSIKGYQLLFGFQLSILLLALISVVGKFCF